MTGAELIAAERRRQIEECGWTAEHDDDKRSYGGLAVTAAMLAVDGTDAHVVDPLGRGTPIPLEQDGDAWGLLRKHGHDGLRCLVIAGALIAAEIDRLQRLSGGDGG